MGLYCGIDLHSNNSVISVLDEEETVVFERRLPNVLEVIVGALKGYLDELVGCVVEATYNWYWLVDGLEDAGFPMVLAHPGGMRQYDGLKHADDVSDARFLARLLRLGILPRGHIMGREERGVRDALRRRMLLVRQRTVLTLSLQGLVMRHTGVRLSSGALSKLGVEGVHERLSRCEASAQVGEVLYTSRAALDAAVEEVERQVLSRCKERWQYRLATTMPGVGQVLGMTIALETGDIERFANAGHYASYARCVKSQRLSNGRRKGEGNRKNGNRYLAWAFIEAAHFAIRYAPQVKVYYQRKSARSHMMVARKAVANKLARAMYHMFRDHTPFEVERAFG